MPDCFVGFDTSNYTTSLSLADADGTLVCNLKKLLPVPAGQKGLRQSDAVFEHTRQLPQLLSELRPFLAGRRILAVGCSTKPRDAEDSYMPCFLAGVNAATAFASACGADMFPFSHQQGHIMAAIHGTDERDRFLTSPFIAFHVSGGTTEALHVIPENGSFAVRLISHTLDISCGQAIDRVGVMLGLPFPCGAELEKLALQNCSRLPDIRASVSEGNCNLSGVVTRAQRLYEETGDANLVAHFTLEYIKQTLIEMIRFVKIRYPDAPFLFAGGVMSNALIRKDISSVCKASFTQPQLASDNAAGIALLARSKYLTQG